MIYIVRHGQTDYNKEGRYGGRIDSDLNEEGIREANLLKEELSNISFDLVFCSPLTRTHHTAKIITNHDIIFDERLLERDNGKLDGMLKKDVPKDIDFNSEDNPYGIESIKHFRNRVDSFLNDITSKYPDKNILVVTHAGVSIYTKCYFDGEPKDGNYLSYKLKNCGIAKYENKKISKSR